jgi:hypothetical protein
MALSQAHLQTADSKHASTSDSIVRLGGTRTMVLVVLICAVRRVRIM